MNDNEMVLVEVNMVSDCCYAPVIRDYMICTNCKDGCNMIPDGEETSSEE